MASEAEFAKALDVWNATLQHIMEAKPALENFAYNKYDLFNVFFRYAKKVKGGDHLEGHITLDNEDNADFVGMWDQDTLAKKNIDSKYTLDWRQAKGGMLWNLMETSLNSGKEKIFDVIDQQYDSCYVDLIDKIYGRILTGPTSATDVKSPYSIFSWLPWGTAASTGGWTGYDGHYNDGGAASAATFDRGGLSCASGTRDNWASWSADHEGDLDDNLYTLLERAVRQLSFHAPTHPRKFGDDGAGVGYSMYTNDNVHSALSSLNAKSDDQFGYRVNEHYGIPSFKGIPFGYVDLFDTANTSVYGTNPIVGLNHNQIYPVVHPEWDFKELDVRDPNRAVVMQKLIYVMFNIWCRNPKRAGFLISQIAT